MDIDVENGFKRYFFPFEVGSIDATNDSLIFGLIASVQCLTTYLIQGKRWNVDRVIHYII